ncbi:MAG TPA: YeeE/YedE thiosulfate transporter family protein [Nevskiales bacterium]|nr:YeeE/YedE thiosulfate transporter family protein [Nevskiales bacterium]
MPASMFALAAVLTVAMMLAAVMGFAIQRGATCTVAAVDEILKQHRAYRLLAMVEASIWVLGGVLIGKALGLVNLMPAGYRPSSLTVLGAVLLGLGAAVNRACVFGAIARFGSGQWAYAATPLGFYLGCLAFPLLFPGLAPTPLSSEAPALRAPLGWAVLAALWMGWRVLRPLATAVRQRTAPAAACLGLRQWLSATRWTPHAATVVIGITFLLLLWLVGAWAYTEVLAELAQGMAMDLGARTLLFLALLAGAAYGGWTAGRFRHTRVTAGLSLRCLAGGLLMGLGSLLIPGGNDGLILLGMPLLWSYAWIAFLTMCLTIALYLQGFALLSRPAA